MICPFLCFPINLLIFSYRGRGRGGNRSKGESGDDEKEDDDDGKERSKGRGRGRFRKYRPRYVRRGGKKSGDEDGPVTSGDEADREVSCALFY